MPFALAGVGLLNSAIVDSTDADAPHRGGVPVIDQVQFRPIRIRPRVIAFRPKGIPPTSVRRAYIRSGHRRRAVSVKYVRHALVTGRFVRLRRHNRFRRHPQRARLVIMYRAPDYFVSTKGSDSNPGTKALPFLSLNKAYQTATPGDSVAVEGGTYTDTASIGFQSSKTSPEDVIFEANGRVHVSLTDPIQPFVISGDHITFKGQFEFDRVFLSDDANSGADDITFRGTQIHAIAVCGQSDYDNFYNNRFGANNLWGSTGSTHTGAGDDNFDSYYCSGGYDPNQANTHLRIVGNRFDGAYHSWDGSHSDCIQFTLGADVLIARNTFRNCQDETIILKGDQGHLSNFTIENNYLGRPLGVTNPFPVQIAGSEPCTGCVLRFNSLPVDAQLAFLNSGSPSNPNTNSIVYGNITVNHSGQCAISVANGWTWDSNLFIGGGTCGTRAVTTSNPYRNSSALDLRLVRGSSAINGFAGPETVPATDIDGTLRPQGRRPDMGAHEVP